jgi:tetratricopeptide (TPR) repeat protein
MALGFGFNKAKVLASAEKAVQQGKLQNAITEYLKVLKEDPKDLTVLNTIGDLHARVGKNDEAAKCFQKVGEQYASDGFAVKAIAMYKKLTKLDSQPETLQRLAELYTVQGLYNDARAQYVQVADAHLKNNNNDDAAKIFQKILELDPDNTAMQSKLADLYIKLGKKNEAVSIYLTAAQNLYIKQAMDAAEEACSKVLHIEKDNIEAKILKGTIAAESGDGQTAYDCLKGVANLDSRPDALRSMLRAQLALKHLDEAEPLVTKLVTVHNDLSGVTWYADALLNESRYADGVAVYEQYADKVLAAQGATLVKNLSAMVTRVKTSSKALLSLKNVFQKAGDTSHEGEISELLAHAYVEEGDLNKAKDLYKTLADNEPENPLHAQNYKQVLAKLGEDTSSQMTAEQGAQAIMAEELELKGPTIKQEYPQETAQAVQQALTDAELYESYNVPAKVVAPLEGGLQHAPRDVRINQKLAAAYAKAQRYVDAARCYNTLQEVFEQAGHKDEAKKYAEMAGTYLAMPSSIAVEAGPVEAAKTAPGADDSSINLIQFSDMQEAPAAAAAAEIAVEAAPPAVAEIAMEVPIAAEPAPAAAEAHEIAVDDWESMLSVEAPPAAPAPEAPIGFEVSVPTPEPAVAEAAPAIASFDVSPPADGAAVAEFSFESATAEAARVAEAPVEEISIPVEAPPTIEVAPPPPPAPKPVAAPPPAPKVEKPAPAPPPPPKAKPAAASTDDDDILGDLVSDLEDSLGDSFLEEKAPAKPAKPAAATPKITPPLPPPPASMPAAAASAAAPAPAKSAAPPSALAQQDAASALSDIFDEFKEDAEATAGEAEDPDTHYNLGIAFKEMGLLDEAIGELQKVAKAIDQGQPFSQQMQAFTWLAQCLVDKGVPMAAVRWYEKALKVPEIDEESKLAVYYDLGNAYEMAGNRQKAHDTFLEVYSSNIDYRDVADRIKALKN